MRFEKIMLQLINCITVQHTKKGYSRQLYSKPQIGRQVY
jgi:hypothetical protein